MIKGILKFKPLEGGVVQVMIKAKEEDIQELSKLYGVEVDICKHVEKADVQPLDKVILSDLHEDLARIQEKIEGHLKEPVKTGEGAITEKEVEQRR